jgi:RHS repeat-associated protein
LDGGADDDHIFVPLWLRRTLLIGLEPLGKEKMQRFYRHQHLVTELQGCTSLSVFQTESQLLAEQRRDHDDVASRLLATDHQRSIQELTHPAVRQGYSPYGHRRVESGLGSLLGFNGERGDPVTGHYLLGNGHRAFNPVLMRFNSRDSLSPFGRGGLNPYAYCLGDPVNFSDPTGRIARLITSLLSVTNTRMGMSRVIPSFNLAKDALHRGAAGQLPFRQTFAAATTVVASGAIFVTGLTGVASAVAAITGDTEASKTLGFIALGLTALAFVSRAGSYWAARDPSVQAGLKAFVGKKGSSTIPRLRGINCRPSAKVFGKPERT